MYQLVFIVINVDAYYWLKLSAR